MQFDLRINHYLFMYIYLCIFFDYFNFLTVPIPTRKHTIRAHTLFSTWLPQSYYKVAYSSFLRRSSSSSNVYFMCNEYQTWVSAAITRVFITNGQSAKSYTPQLPGATKIQSKKGVTHSSVPTWTLRNSYLLHLADCQPPQAIITNLPTITKRLVWRLSNSQ